MTGFHWISWQKFIVWLVLIFSTNRHNNVLSSNSKSFRPCVESVFNHTQECTNHNYMIVTTTGYKGVSFATEFVYYTMRSAWMSMFTNHRFVYLISKRDWEYDCVEKLGWACYFKFDTCTDSAVLAKDINFLYGRNPGNKWGAPGPKFAERNLLESIYFHPVGYTTALSFLVGVYANRIPKDICVFKENDVLLTDEIAGVFATNIFQLNAKTVTATNKINKHYENLASVPYAGLIVQTDDIFGRNSNTKEELEQLSDPNFLVSRLLEAVSNHTTTRNRAIGSKKDKKDNIRDIYLSINNCTAAGAVMNILAPKGYKLHGACFQHFNKTTIVVEPKKKSGHEEALAYIADLVMLQRGALYVANFNSDFSRMAHYLRYPSYDNTYSLLPRYDGVIADSIFQWSFFF